MKTILLKLTKASSKLGPFDIIDQFGNVIASNVSIYTLIEGINYDVEDNVDVITLTSRGNCTISRMMPITTVTVSEFIYTKFEEVKTACLWKHLTFNTFNKYYGVTEPYIIEYPVAYSPQDQILQSVKSYDKVFKYLSDPSGVFSYTDRLQLDNAWFDHAILYNGQQCTGILELVPKPKNNLQTYNSYPIYKTDSKVITYTQSDNIFQYNTFWNLLKNKNIPIAITSCESLSYDGIVNNANMDYSNRSFNKDPMRAKDLKIRHSLTQRSDIHIVSQFVIVSTQISYK